MPARNGLEAPHMSARLTPSSLVAASVAHASLALSAGCGSAGEPPAVQNAHSVASPARPILSPARLERHTYESSATKANRDYFVYVPEGYDDAPAKKWPVLVFLHGNGERGNAAEELDYLLVNGPLYEAWIQKRNLPFVIVAPQLPMYGQDEKADYLRDRSRSQIPARLDEGVPERPAEFATDFPMNGALAEATLPLGPDGPPMGWPVLETDVMTLLGQVRHNFRTDPKRHYLTGVSYGGFGTWYLASRHAQLFAAIAPVVGYGHKDLMPPIAEAQLPVWCFAGGRDGGVKAQYFYPGLNYLESLGHSSLKFTIEADMGHDVWARVYAGQDLYSWLLQHTNPTTGALQ